MKSTAKWLVIGFVCLGICGIGYKSLCVGESDSIFICLLAIFSIIGIACYNEK